MLEKVVAKMRRGQVYEGYAAWCDDYGLVPRPGYYALSDDGKRVIPEIALVCVDDAPGDPENGACHYEYASPGDYPQRSGKLPVGPDQVVLLQMNAEGRSSMEVG